MEHLAKSEQDVAKWLETSKVVDTVDRIPGDASTRRYYRVHSRDQSMIVMKMESFAQEGAKLPFIEMQKYLSSAGVDVPRVFDFDADKGFILLEDLGDVTALRSLQNISSPLVEKVLYQRILDNLVNLQVDASPARKPASIQAFKLRFDFEKLFWEITHTIEHFYEGYLKRKISDPDRKIMLEGFSKICKRLEAEPTVLAHRDFHSRNIMIIKDRVVMIDFQDARLGPPQYDLASLLRDSYYQLEEAQIDRLLDYYFMKYEDKSGESIDRIHFREIFDLMAVQRNFKAIGSFASFLNRRGDPSYLKFIGNTFENIRRTLLNYPEFSSLREVLFHYYYF